MSEGTTPSKGMGAGKIVLIVVLVVLGLGAICCGIGALFVGPKMKQGIQFGTSTAAFAQKLIAEFGDGSTFNPVPGESGGFTLLVGIPRDFADDEVAALQDRVWAAYCECHAEGGYPVSGVAVGRVDPANPTAVKGWMKNMIPVADLESRTGKKCPKVLEFMAEAMQQGHVKIRADGTVEPDASADDESGDGDKPEDTQK